MICRRPISVAPLLAGIARAAQIFDEGKIIRRPPIDGDVSCKNKKSQYPRKDIAILKHAV